MKNKLSLVRLLKLSVLFFFLSGTTTHVYAQFYSVQTNALELATTTLNVEGSMMFSRRWTAHLGVAYNPWTFKNNWKMKQFTLEPGVRYWMNQTYMGSFVSGYAIASRYNFTLGDNRYDGKGIGLGATYGRTWLLSTRWNLEAEAGLGFIWGDCIKYQRCLCGDLRGKSNRAFLVPKAAVNLVYLF